jgi:hypothetical protein
MDAFALKRALATKDYSTHRVDMLSSYLYRPCARLPSFMIVAIFALQLGDTSHLADIATQIASVVHCFLLVKRKKGMSLLRLFIV